MSSIGPLNSSSALTESRPTNGWGYSSDPVIDEVNHQAHAALTASDKEFLHATTGEDVKDGQGMSILAFTIARDRLSGKLPAGSSIDSKYLEGLIRTYSGSGADGETSIFTGDSLKNAQSYLSAHGGKAPVDFTA